MEGYIQRIIILDSRLRGNDKIKIVPNKTVTFTDQKVNIFINNHARRT